MRSLLVVDGAAGLIRPEELADILGPLSRQADVEVCAAESPGELDGILQRRGGRALVIAGDDRAVHGVVNALYRRMELSAGPIGLLPLGRVNAFARSLHVPLDPAAATRVLLRAPERACDLMLDSSGEVAVCGVRVRPAPPEVDGRWTDHAAELLARVRHRALRIAIEADGRPVVDVDRPVAGVSFGTGSHVATHVTAPGAQTDDGDVHVSVRVAGTAVRAIRRELCRPRGHRGGAAAGRLGDGAGRTTRVRARSLTISGQPFLLDVDGAVLGPQRRASWTIQPKALRVLANGAG